MIILLLLGVGNVLWSQTPTKCVEMESILVDACGTPEGENEMIRFRIGPSDLNVNDLVVDWPNNSWQGICQNATTTNAVSALNSTIQGCGWLVEPTGGILPAGEPVILVTSTAIDVSANSFANLNDTITMIFQCAGNTSGHFANYNSSPGLRTTIISFTNPTGCADTATYDRSESININGGYGGGWQLQNGGRVDFAWDGTPTYENDGCQAPIINTTVNINTTPSTCTNGSVAMEGSVNGPYSEIFWSGGTGIYSDSDSLSTIYSLGSGDQNDFYIYLSATNPCNDTITDSVLVDFLEEPDPQLVINSSMPICYGDSVEVLASGGDTYNWSNGGTGTVAYFGDSGTYQLTVANACGSADTAFNINVIYPPQATIAPNNYFEICIGDTVPLIGSGGDFFSWSTGDTASTVVLDQIGWHYGVAHNTCFTDTAFVELALSPEDECGGLWTDIVYPNVITPNADGLNDGWQAIWWVGVTEFLGGTIYNRWGQVQHHWEDINDAWDGSNMEGIRVSEGTYYYTVELKDHKDDIITKKGTISVFRAAR